MHAFGALLGDVALCRCSVRLTKAQHCRRAVEHAVILHLAKLLGFIYAGIAI